MEKPFFGHRIEEKYDHLLIWGSRANALYYGIPASVLLLVLWWANIPNTFWTPVMIVYLIGALAHILNYGFQAVCAQMNISARLTVELLKEN